VAQHDRLRATTAGISAEDMVFSGVGKTAQELRDAVAAGIGLINLESLEEFDLLAEIAREGVTPVAAGIRVNPEVTAETHPYTRTGERGMKFGIPLDQVVELALAVSRDPMLRLRSLGMHLGSQIADPEPYRTGGARLLDLVEAIRAAGIDTLKSVNIGGGMAIAHGDVPAMDPNAFVDSIREVQERTGLTILLEPGRFIVGEAGLLLTSVLYTKHTGGRDFVVVDAGMNDLVRPSYYEAVHDIRVVRPTAVGVATPRRVDIVGPICETGDFLGHDRCLPGAGRGALVAICGAGAYGFAMASTYNSRPRPAEVLVNGDAFAVIRRREPYEHLWRDEVERPHWVPLVESGSLGAEWGTKTVSDTA
jgi:diaminopimelate decarboxylase